jgi:hypothetical protein
MGFRERQWKGAAGTCLKEVGRDVVGGSVVAKFENDATEVKADSVLEFVDDDEMWSEWPFPAKWSYVTVVWDALKGSDEHCTRKRVEENK